MLYTQNKNAFQLCKPYSLIMFNCMINIDNNKNIYNFNAMKIK